MDEDEGPLINAKPRQWKRIRRTIVTLRQTSARKGEVLTTLIADIAGKVPPFGEHSFDALEHRRYLVERVRTDCPNGIKKEIATTVVGVEPRGLQQHGVTGVRCQRAKVLGKFGPGGQGVLSIRAILSRQTCRGLVGAGLMMLQAWVRLRLPVRCARSRDICAMRHRRF